MTTPASTRSGGLFTSSLFLCILILLGMSVPGRAQIVTLAHNNSVAQINVGSSAGMFNWNVQGLNQLNQQWFWYRIGNAAEAPINTINAPTITLFNGTRGLSVLYTLPGIFNLQIDYLLTGGAFVGNGQTGASDIAETITVNRLSAGPVDMHFFQYSDFDIGGNLGDTVQLGTNLSGKFNEAVQQQGGVGLTETVAAPGADHGEAALFNTTLLKLNNGVADNLNDNAGPITGDATWALQWDFVLDANNPSKIISKDKNLIVVVPEPSTGSLIVLGLAGSLLCAWRRRSSGA